MKKTLLKKLTVGLLLAVSAFSLAGCNSNEKSKESKTTKKEELKVSKTDFETQTISLDKVTFELPKEWSKFDIPNAPSGYISYAPANADINVGSSSVNINVSKQKQKITIKDLNASRSDFEKQYKASIKEAKDFKFSDFKAPSGDVFAIQYNYTINGVYGTVSQYMVLLDGYAATITATDINDGSTPSPHDVARYMANTVKLK